ncbi:unnamed protein product [Peniophora sp. CBMAI 1063]|nr:unnamed protein product [Peniophora sp. CBMAI 1063]
MTDKTLLGAPPDFFRALQGLDVQSTEESTDPDGDSGREAHYRTYMASAFIYACVDQDSSNWSDYLQSTIAEQSTIITDTSDAPRISICEDDECDNRLQEAVCEALPGLSNPCIRPSDQLVANTDVWRCPVERCRESVRPFNLTNAQCDVVVALAGDFDSMMIRGDSGRVRLRRQDPWAFLRYVDAVAWEHISWHLHRAHITFYYPHPHMPYKERPGWWWDESLLARDQPLLQDLKAIEATNRQNRRQWLVTKAISSAQRKIERARARLTRWRYDALRARRELVSAMFEINRDVVDVSLSLLALVRQQATDHQRTIYTWEIAHYRGVEAEWTEEQFMWV